MNRPCSRARPGSLRPPPREFGNQPGEVAIGVIKDAQVGRRLAGRTDHLLKRGAEEASPDSRTDDEPMRGGHVVVEHEYVDEATRARACSAPACGRYPHSA